MILFLAIMVSCVDATQVETTQVEPLTKRMLVFDLDDGDKVTGLLSISGGLDNDIDFWVTNPQGTTIVNLGRVNQGASFNFTVHQSGAYTFHFDNTFSLISSKTVSLTFDVSGALPITPTTLFVIAVIIVGIAIIAIGIPYVYVRSKQAS